MRPFVPVALACALLAAACDPVGNRPGSWLRGDAVGTPVADWTFTDDEGEIFIETRLWYALPYSVTIWCAELDGTLYVGSYGDEKKLWVKNIERSPDARLEIGGRLYPVTLTPVDDPDLTARIDDAYERKYDVGSVFGDDPPEWWYYRVEQQTS